MSLIIWEEKYSVGVKELDNQHQILVDLINQMHESMKLGKSKELVPQILNNLIKYTKEHFNYEEGYMQKIGHPDLQGHKLQHDQFIKRILKFKNDYEAGKVGLNFEILTFLKDWLVGHICVSDQRYMKK